MAYVLLAQTITPGDYIFLPKVIVFVVLFVLCCRIQLWLDKDAAIVEINRHLWNKIYLGSGTAVLLLWFMLPAPFVVELLLLLVVWSTVFIAYLLYRNARVPDYDRILTVNHLKSQLTALTGKKTEKKHVIFVTANKNELPVPLRQDPEYRGYIAAEELLGDLCYRRVSQCDLIPTGEHFQTNYTIDGVIIPAQQRSRGLTDIAINYLKEVAGMDVNDHRKPQNGHFTIKIDGKNIRWRVNTSGSTRGEHMTISRAEEMQSLTLDAVGFNSEQLQNIKKNMQKKEGVILISGPPGSGVTTTLYAILRAHDAFIQHIQTFEKTFLVDLDNITQNKFQNDAGLPTAARQLLTVLRTDPDILLVGFCDAAEMAQIGIQAAQNGKKLYYGLPAPSAFHALQYWIKLVNNNESVARTLLFVTNQRLLRKLCPECRQAYTPDTTLLKKLNLPTEKIKPFYRPPVEPEYDKRNRPVLCPKCQGTGYFGRIAVLETIFVSDETRKLIAEGAPVNVIRTQCRKEKTLYLQEHALSYVLNGTTSIQEVLRITSEQKPKDTPANAAAAADSEADGDK